MRLFSFWVPRKRITAGVILSLVIVAACSKAPPAQHRLTGQVFIVTRGKESVKMGLVEVSLYDLRVLEEWQKEFAPTLADLQKRAEELADEAAIAHNNARDYAQRLLDNYRLEDHEFISAAAKRAGEARDVRKAAAAYVRITQSALPYFGALPKQRLVSTKTDADGNFSLDLPADAPASCALVAFTSRAIPGGEEVYLWAVAVPKGVSRVVLSNDNLSSADSQDSLIHTADIDPELAKSLSIDEDNIRQRVAKLINSPPSQSQPVATTQAEPETSATPLPEFDPLPPPTFVRLTDWFALTNTKGKEIKALEPGKRLRVVSRTEDKITVDYLGEHFSIPAALTEPSQ